MKKLPLFLILCAGLAACATPENRRELYSPAMPYEPLKYEPPTRSGDGRMLIVNSPTNTTVWYGPDQRAYILGTWRMTPAGYSRRVPIGMRNARTMGMEQRGTQPMVLPEATTPRERFDDTVNSIWVGR